MAKCIKCGAAIEAGNAFCMTCGANQKEDKDNIVIPVIPAMDPDDSTADPGRDYASELLTPPPKQWDKDSERPEFLPPEKDSPYAVPSVLQYLGLLLLLLLPGLGQILAIIWACQSRHNRNRSNLARAVLVLTGLFLFAAAVGSHFYRDEVLRLLGGYLGYNCDDCMNFFILRI